VAAVTGGAPSGDLLTGVFKVGDPDDKVLDTLKATLAQAGMTLNDLRLSAFSGAPFLAALARGSLVDPAAVVTTLTTAQIDGGPLKALTGPAKCDVKVVALNYNTVGVKGEKTNASGVMLVPAGTCTAAAGLLAYAKGTDVQKPRTLVNPADGETFLLAAMYAAQGYAVVATDYLGFAKSAYTYHPYLHADSEATSVIDSIRAARRAAGTVGATLSGKVMLAGYSQGGHSSMAAHRAIERDHASEINVIAGAHLAGPYNLTGSLKLPNAIAGYQFFVPYLVTSWQKIYGNIYSSPSVAFKAPYDSYIETLLPNPTLTTTTLVTTGQLPGGPGVSPNQARDAIFQPAFLADAQTNSNNPLFLAGKKNDLLGWNPKSAVLLCGGAGDPTVPPAVHQAAMKADFDSRGLTNVKSVDVDPFVRATYGPGGVAPTDPTSAAFATYYGNYHGTYEPPFCHAQAKGVFDAVSLAATAP
jgi:pimeloyl-ACP methyl ester carboxylesterase